MKKFKDFATLVSYPTFQKLGPWIETQIWMLLKHLQLTYE